MQVKHLIPNWMATFASNEKKKKKKKKAKGSKQKTNMVLSSREFPLTDWLNRMKKVWYKDERITVLDLVELKTFTLSLFYYSIVSFLLLLLHFLLLFFSYFCLFSIIQLAYTILLYSKIVQTGKRCSILSFKTHPYTI